MPGDGATRFGQYRLLRVVARDAVSTTYVAVTDGAAMGAVAPGDHVALQVVDRLDDGDEPATETARRFLSEAQQVSVVDHPTVLRPVDAGMVDGQAFVATPYLRAVPLAELLAHGGRIAATPALAMFAQLAGGLDAAHRAGLVHGALNPLTIWVAPAAAGTSYVAHLTGFGGARLLRRRMASQARGTVVDDVLYLAPEQLRGAPAAPASDQYALACALYHVLAGVPPYVQEARAKLYGAHLLAPTPALAARHPSAAGSTSDALRRAMAKDPRARFASCGEMIHEALPAVPDEPVRAASVPGPPWRRDRGHVARAARTWGAVLLAGVALLALLGAVWITTVARGG